MSSEPVNESICVAVPINDALNDEILCQNDDDAMASKSATKSLIKAAVVLSMGSLATTLFYLMSPIREPEEIQLRHSFLREFVPPPPLQPEKPYDHTIRPRYFLRKFVPPPPLLEESRDHHVTMSPSKPRCKNLMKVGILRSFSSDSRSNSRDHFDRWYARNNSPDGMMIGENQDSSRSVEGEESSETSSEEDFDGAINAEALKSVYYSVLSKERARTDTSDSQH
ncbi:hypothetical protein ACHAW6_011021 [Cyclotella cf. meneghiniana]